MPFADGLSDDLRCRWLAIPQIPSSDDLQDWDIIKEELERETTKAAARTRAGYATVLQTKSCQLQWGESDLANLNRTLARRGGRSYIGRTHFQL